MEPPSYGYWRAYAPEGLEQEFAVFLVAPYVNDRDLADPEDGFVIVQAE